MLFSTLGVNSCAVRDEVLPAASGAKAADKAPSTLCHLRKNLGDEQLYLDCLDGARHSLGEFLPSSRMSSSSCVFVPDGFDPSFLLIRCQEAEESTYYEFNAVKRSTSLTDPLERYGFKAVSRSPEQPLRFNYKLLPSLNGQEGFTYAEAWSRCQDLNAHLCTQTELVALNEAEPVLSKMTYYWSAGPFCEPKEAADKRDGPEIYAHKVWAFVPARLAAYSIFTCVDKNRRSAHAKPLETVCCR